jgi:hypothetical protein
MFLGEARNITELMFLGKPKNIAPYVSQGSPRNISIIFLGQPRNIIDEHKIFFFKNVYFVCLPGWGASKTGIHILQHTHK